MQEPEDDDIAVDDDRADQLRSVAIKALALVLVVAVAVGVGSWAMVRSLGLNDAEVTGVGPGRVHPITPLPTTALPVPSSRPSPDGLAVPGPAVTPSGDLLLNASPLVVEPMERINLTGQWPGHDSTGLLVQRLEGGQWVDFGVQARVRVNTFETYVLTGRQGDQIFRVYDPATKIASNQVTVTVS